MRGRFSARKKIYGISLLMTLMAFAVYTIHAAWVSLMLAFAIPMLVTVVYADQRLTAMVSGPVSYTHLEMQGNIIYVDYERSSWRYMNYERSFRREGLDAFKIGSTSSNHRDTIEPYLIGKGGGSAYGEKWKPNPNKDVYKRQLITYAAMRCREGEF